MPIGRIASLTGSTTAPERFPGPEIARLADRGTGLDSTPNTRPKGPPCASTSYSLPRSHRTARCELRQSERLRSVRSMTAACPGVSMTSDRFTAAKCCGADRLLTAARTYKRGYGRSRPDAASAEWDWRAGRIPLDVGDVGKCTDRRGRCRPIADRARTRRALQPPLHGARAARGPARGASEQAARVMRARQPSGRSAKKMM